MAARDVEEIAAELAEWRNYCKCSEGHQHDERCDGSRCVAQEAAILDVLKGFVA